MKKVKWNINRDSMENKQRELRELFEPLKKDLKYQVAICHFSNKINYDFLRFFTVNVFSLLQQWLQKNPILRVIKAFP